MKRLVLTLLFLGLIGGAGYGGWQYWQNHHSTKTSLPAQTIDKPTIIDPTEDGKYFVIKEWGVRFKSQPELKNSVVYQVIGADSDGIDFSYSRTNLSELCSLDSDYISKYGNDIETGLDLIRSKVALDTSIRKWSTSLVLQVANQYYYLETAPSGCTGGDNSVTSDIVTLKDSLKTLSKY